MQRGNGGNGSRRVSNRVKPNSSRRPIPLDQEEWYHGLLPRQDIERLLVRQGDFLVRLTEMDGQKTNIISVKWAGEAKHIKINSRLVGRQQRFYVDKKDFDSIGDLIRFYMTKSEPIAKLEALLLNPVPRQGWEIRHDQIKLIKKLGEGAFGEVYMGELKNDKGITRVAVKKHHNTCELNKALVEDMCREARMMQKIVHKNVVRFHGVAAEKPPLMLCMELVTGGSLDSYLKKNAGKLDKTKLIRMCDDAARGLDYLHSIDIVHRDIAARNCLIDGQCVVKISDFGLSKEGIGGNNCYKMQSKTKVPIKWLAVETLRLGIYSKKSDVWSFGIMMWEIFNDAADPYPNLTVAEVRSRVTKQSYRMDPPSRMPVPVTSLMRKCWEEQPAARPDFKTIYTELSRMKNTTK